MRLPAVIGVIFLMGAGAAGASMPLKIDERRSQIEVEVHATAHRFTALLGAFTSTVMADAEMGHVTDAHLVFHFADLTTGNQARDRAMQEWQQTAEFPDGDFALATLVPVGGGHFIAHGRLTLHGCARELGFPVSITTDRKIYAIDGAVLLDTRDYGLPVIRKLGVLRVNPKVTVRFHVQGSLVVAESVQGSPPRSVDGKKTSWSLMR